MQVSTSGTSKYALFVALFVTLGLVINMIFGRNIGALSFSIGDDVSNQKLYHSYYAWLQAIKILSRMVKLKGFLYQNNYTS